MIRRASAIIAVGVLVVLFVPSAGLAGGCHASSRATPGKGAGRVTVAIESCGYSPAILYVEPGTEVTWSNHDPLPHSITGMGSSLAGEETFEAGNETEAFRFDSAGVYPYYCILHPGMAGAVVVGDVSSEKAAAPEQQSMPVAVPVAAEQPPAGPAQNESSIVVPVATALVAMAIAAAFLLGRRRREREPQTA